MFLCTRLKNDEERNVATYLVTGLRIRDRLVAVIKPSEMEATKTHKSDKTRKFIRPATLSYS